ncbi:MAG: hypothetical protein GTO45_39110 [Candidatus Aminicenantes bacterium]|nr:hypothetical protein [Candidatus Aminicenantes bacterium]NIM84634.1 hypothetical protein [Candidatus Aminicenantes bacterium]NIN24139.1 hypothetical protein [Candidatus Aminicenantes bacterium]NIN47863.1 hypothetical protein [Candidatus Aminicenantes bacterium]NIN90801.1 hypothetical protein [Candidatus Aminicenantes bacterium]
MKTTLILATILVTGFLLYPEKVATLDELANPFIMQVDESQLYITDSETVLIYSLKDYKLQNKFGKKGEGPGEFRISPTMSMGSVMLDVYPDYLIVNSMGKVSFFSKQGKFIKEMRTISPLGMFKQIGNRFVGYGFSMDNDGNYMTTNIWDAKLSRVIKELHQEKQWFVPGSKMDAFGLRTGFFFVADNKIFVENEKRNILIFDENGKKLGSIDPAIEPVKMTKSFKEGFHHYLKTTARFKQFYPFLKDMLTFPDYFPGIRLYYAADNTIYILSWRKKNGQSECFVYDLKGKLINKTYLPFIEQTEFFQYTQTFGNGKFYQGVESEDGEVWELHVTEVK